MVKTRQVGLVGLAWRTVLLLTGVFVFVSALWGLFVMPFVPALFAIPAVRLLLFAYVDPLLAPILLPLIGVIICFVISYVVFAPVLALWLSHKASKFGLAFRTRRGQEPRCRTATAFCLVWGIVWRSLFTHLLPSVLIILARTNWGRVHDETYAALMGIAQLGFGWFLSVLWLYARPMGSVGIVFTPKAVRTFVAETSVPENKEGLSEKV